MQELAPLRGLTFDLGGCYFYQLEDQGATGADVRAAREEVPPHLRHPAAARSTQRSTQQQGPWRQIMSCSWACQQACVWEQGEGTPCRGGGLGTDEALSRDVPTYPHTLPAAACPMVNITVAATVAGRCTPCPGLGGWPF